MVNNSAITSLRILIAICFNQLIAEITKGETKILIKIMLIYVLLNFILELRNELTSLILHAAKMDLNSIVVMAED